MDALLGGYASSDDETADKQQISALDAQGSPAPVSDSAADKAERKKSKKEKKDRKAAKHAAAAAAAAAPVSLNAPLPTPKLSLPSAAGLLAAASSKAPTFLQLQAADRAREAMEALESGGDVVVRSQPTGVHQEASLRAMQKQKDIDAAEKAREEALSQPERESLRAKRKALADANARMAESEAADYGGGGGEHKKKKKTRLEDGTGGPARASDDIKLKEQAKRGKGQSGIETGWKPEIWMQQRQNYDG